jgi:hypothetical protein
MHETTTLDPGKGSFQVNVQLEQSRPTSKIAAIPSLTLRPPFFANSHVEIKCAEIGFCRFDYELQG